MARESYNIIGTDRIGDWLLVTVDGKANARTYVERAKRTHPQYYEIKAVKCSA